MKVINDLIEKLIMSFSYFYESLGLHTAISNLIGYLDDWQTYQATFAEYMSGVYFLFGKSLIVYMVTVFTIIFLVRLIFAVINLVGQFIP